MSLSRARPFDCSEILRDLFYESETALYYMAKGHYYFRLEEEERGSQTYQYKHVQMNSVEEAADSLHKTLFKFYFLTEARFLTLLRDAMRLIRFLKSQPGIHYLEDIGYPDDGEFHSMDESSLVKEFMKDFSENFKFRKMNQDIAEYAFYDLDHYINELHYDATNHYDSVKAALFRSSASLGILLRLVSGVAKHAENRALDGKMIDLFRHWKLTSRRNLPYDNIMRTENVDFLQPEQFNQPNFFEVASDFPRDVRVMLMLSGAKRGTFDQFITDIEGHHLHGNELVNIQRFNGVKLIDMMKEWLRTHPMRYPVDDYFKQNTKELKNAMTDTRIPDVNIDFLYNDLRAIQAYHAEEEPPAVYKQTAGEGGGYAWGETTGYEDPYAPTPGEPVKVKAAPKKEDSAAKSSDSSGLLILGVCIAGGAAIYYS